MKFGDVPTTSPLATDPPFVGGMWVASSGSLTSGSFTQLNFGSAEIIRTPEIILIGGTNIAATQAGWYVFKLSCLWNGTTGGFYNQLIVKTDYGTITQTYQNWTPTQGATGLPANFLMWQGYLKGSYNDQLAPSFKQTTGASQGIVAYMTIYRAWGP